MPATIGTAYVKILPDMTGIQSDLTSALDDGARSAGASGGQTYADSFSDAMKSASATLAPVSNTLMSIGKTAINAAADYEQGMDKVQAISGATGEQMERLSEKALEMANKTQFSATDAAAAYSYMGMAGWKSEQMIEGLPGIMNLAQASGVNLATTSDIVTDALTAFGRSADESGRFADALAAASINANTNVDLLGYSFKYVAPIAGAAKYSYQDITTALGLMANAGIKGTQAGTSLRNIISRMTSPTDESAKAMNNLGIQIDDGQGHMYSFREIMEQLRESFSGLSYDQEAYAKGAEELTALYEAGSLTESQYADELDWLAESTLKSGDAQAIQNAKWLAGQYGLAGLLSIVNASDEDFNNMISAIDSSGDAMAVLADGSIVPLSEAIANGDEVIQQFNGTAEAMGFVMQDNLNGRIGLLNSALETLYIEFMEAVLPVLTEGVDVITNVVTWFSSLDEGTRNLIVTVGGVLAVASPVLGFIGNVSDGISGIINVGGKLAEVTIPAVQNGFSVLAESAGGVTGALGGIAKAAGIAADALRVAYDVKTLWEATEDYKAAADAHANEVETALSSYVKLYETKGKEIADQWAATVYQLDTSSMSMDEAQKAITEKVESYWDDVPQNMWDGFKAGWNDYFGEDGKGLLALVGDGLGGMLNGIADMLGIHSPSTVFRDFGENVSLGFRQGYEDMWPDVEKVASWEAEDLLAIFDSLPDVMVSIGDNFITGLWNGMNFASTWLYSSVRSIAQGIANTFTGFFGISSPSKLFAEYGGFMMAGIAEGIEENVDDPLREMVNAGSMISGAFDASALANTASAYSLSARSFAGRQLAADTASAAPRNLTVVLELDRTQLGRVVYRLNNEELQRVGVKLAGGVV